MYLLSWKSVVVLNFSRLVWNISSGSKPAWKNESKFHFDFSTTFIEMFLLFHHRLTQVLLMFQHRYLPKHRNVLFDWIDHLPNASLSVFHRVNLNDKLKRKRNWKKEHFQINEHFPEPDKSTSTAIISTIFDDRMTRFCKSNVWDELSIVSIRSIADVDKLIISLLLLSIRWATERTTSPLDEIVSKTPWKRSCSLVWMMTGWP